MEIVEYQYEPKFSKQTNESFKIFHNIYEDCRLILNAQKHIEWVTGEKSSESADEIMNNFN